MIPLMVILIRRKVVNGTVISSQFEEKFLKELSIVKKIYFCKLVP